MRNLLLIGLLLVILSTPYAVAGEFRTTASGEVQFELSPYEGRGFESKSNTFAGAGVSFQAKNSCTDVQVEFDGNAFAGQAMDVMRKLVKDPKILVVNGAIKMLANFWAMKECGGSMEKILMEYPEQAQKMIACIQTGMSDAARTTMGVAAGSASFALVDQQINPGVASGITGCLTGEAADKFGDGFRRCIDRETEANVESIRSFMNWAIEFNVNQNFKAQQACILEEQARETDFVKASQTYGEIKTPDGTLFKCEGDSCRPEKSIGDSIAALSKQQSNDIKKKLFENITNAFKKGSAASLHPTNSSLSTISDKYRDKVNSMVFSWFKGNFFELDHFSIEDECKKITHASPEKIIFDRFEELHKKGEPYASEVPELRQFFERNKPAVTQTVDLIKQTCKTYITLSQQAMHLNALNTPIAAINSASQQSVYELGLAMEQTNQMLKKTADDARETALQALSNQETKANEQVQNVLQETLDRIKSRRKQ